MSEIVIKIIRAILYFFLFILVLRIIGIGYEELIKKGALVEEMKKNFQESKEKFIQDIKKSVGWENIFPNSETIMTEGLKLNLELFQDSKKFFSILFSVSQNNIYWKIGQNQPSFLSIFLSPLFQWNNYELKKEELEDIKMLENILTKIGIVENLEKINQGYKIEINKEKLKNGIFEWKKDWKTKEGEKFFEDLGEISGLITIGQKQYIQNIHLKTRSLDIILKVENLEERISKMKKEESLENFLISLFQKYAQLF